MRVGITAKLFLAILLANATIAVVVSLAAQYALKTGFRNYVNEREERRLSLLAESLADAWRERGSFEFLRSNDGLWREYNRPGPPRPRGDGAENRRAPPRFDGSNDPPPRFESGDRPPPRNFDAGRGPPRGPPPSATLFDAGRRRIVGEDIALDRATLRPVAVAGETVGWIGSLIEGEPFDRADLRFQNEQLRASWIIAGIAVLLAALVSILLARRLLEPVKRLAVATHRLAGGDYATRVPTASNDELGQLTADFNHLAIALEKNEALRRTFMAEISHELRTPLAVLKGELEALEDGIRTPNAESLRSLQAEVATLSKLIDDLYDLSLADIGALTYRLEPVDVGALVEDATRAFADRFLARGLAIERPLPDTPIVIDGDPVRLTQLFNNLLENSLRYTDSGGKLRIALRRDRGRVILDFMDSAPAVPEGLLPRLFERLFRVDESRSRARGGAGLGLALCRSIVEAHGGQIAAKPSPLGGLWVEAALPVARNDAPS